MRRHRHCVAAADALGGISSAPDRLCYLAGEDAKVMLREPTAMTDEAYARWAIDHFKLS